MADLGNESVQGVVVEETTSENIEGINENSDQNTELLTHENCEASQEKILVGFKIHPFYKPTETFVAQIEEAKKLDLIIDYDNFEQDMEAIQNKLYKDPKFSSGLPARYYLMKEIFSKERHIDSYDSTPAEYVCFERNDKVEFCLRNMKNIESNVGKSLLIKIWDTIPDGYEVITYRTRTEAEIEAELESDRKKREEIERQPLNRLKRCSPKVAVAAACAFAGFMAGRHYK